MHGKPTTVVLTRIAVIVIAVTVLGVACTTQEEPFALGERATPTPLPEGMTVEEVEPEVDPEDEPAIKIAASDDNRVSLTSFIAGYVIAHGFRYKTATVELESGSYQDAVANGEVDIVLAVAPDSYTTDIESGAVLAVGSPFQDEPNARMVVYPGLKGKAPEVVEFLAKVQPGDETLAGLTARMSAGRVGIRANVAALTFLKRNEPLWTQWVEQQVVENVKRAIDNGEAGFCREWEIAIIGPYTMKTCKDDRSHSIRL